MKNLSEVLKILSHNHDRERVKDLSDLTGCADRTISKTMSVLDSENMMKAFTQLNPGKI